MTYTFPGCNCVFPTEGEVNGRPKIRFNPALENIPLTCPRTWALISSGHTKGIFQLESRLGQSYAGKLKPENIEHLSALVAILRPGVLESISDGKSITQHYIDRKNKIDEIKYFHSSLEPSLKATMGCMIYQESLMQIAKDVAGFNLKEAHLLMKAVGKKKPEIMAKVKIEFLEKCKQTLVLTTEEAEQVFDWMEKSQRYLFNRSHSVAYGLNGYLSAYTKAHFPKAFYTSYLFYAKEKQKPHIEIRELVSDARNSGIDIYPPDFRNLNDHFRIISGKIYFGFSDIKGIGDSVFERTSEQTSLIEKVLNKPRNQWKWVDFLLFLSQRITSTAVSAMIKTGALDYFKVSRQRMEYEYLIYSKLSDAEIKKLERLLLLRDDNDKPKFPIESLEEALRLIIGLGSGKEAVCHTKTRLAKIEGFLQALQNPPHSLEDTALFIQQEERRLLGVNLSNFDKNQTLEANCTIREYNKGKCNDGALILCSIERVKETKTKNGKNPGQTMGFIEVYDNTGSMDSVVLFPEQWEEFSHMLFEDNEVLLEGKKGNKGGFICENIRQA